MAWALISRGALAGPAKENASDTELGLGESLTAHCCAGGAAPLDVISVRGIGEARHDQRLLVVVALLHPPVVRPSFTAMGAGI